MGPHVFEQRIQPDGRQKTLKAINWNFVLCDISKDSPYYIQQTFEMNECLVFQETKEKTSGCGMVFLVTVLISTLMCHHDVVDMVYQ